MIAVFITEMVILFKHVIIIVIIIIIIRLQCHHQVCSNQEVTENLNVVIIRL